MTRSRRPNLYVISALKRRYAMAKGEMAARDMFTDLERIRADMAHLGAVILMFEPTADLAAIRAVRPYQANRGNWARMALDIIRTSDRPLRTWELARMVMARQGIEPDRAALFSIGCSLQAVLGKRAEEGVIRAFGKPRRWAATLD